MDYVIEEIVACLAVASILAALVGWLAHAVFAHNKLRTLEINKNLEIEQLQGELAGARQTQAQVEESLDKAAFQAKDANAKLQAATRLAQEQLAKHQSEAAALTTRIATLVPLETAVAERDTRLDSWQRRFDGLVAEKDGELTALRSQLSSLSGLPAELAGHKTQLASVAAALAAAEAARLGLESKLADAQKHSTEMQNIVDLHAHDSSAADRAMIDKLQATLTDKDKLVTDLQAKTVELEQRHQALTADHQSKLEEVNSLVSQRDEQLKSFDQRMRGATAERDTVIGKLRGLVVQIDPLRAQIAERDQTIEQLRKQIEGAKHGSDAGLEEAQRQLHALMASSQSMKTALEGKDAEIAALAAKAAQLPKPDGTLAAKDERIALLESQVVDVTGHHAAAKSELNDWAARYAALEAQLHRQTSEHEAALHSVDSKQQELEKANAEVARLDAQFMAALTGAPHVAEPHVPAAAAPPAPAADSTIPLKARIAELERALDEELPNEAKLRQAIAANQSEMAELRAQIADRDERLEAWDSRFHASIGELHGEVGTLTAKAHSYEAELKAKEEQINRLRAELAAAPLTMAAAAGAGVATAVSHPPPAYGFATPVSNDPHPSVVRKEEARQLRELLDGGLSMRGVQFLPSSSELIPQSLPILEQAADALHKFPDVAVEVAGHTDSWGEPQDNFRLSQERAAAVKEYLVNSGIAAWRLIDIGYGDTQPIDSNDTADGRFANRRIELHVR